MYAHTQFHTPFSGLLKARPNHVLPFALFSAYTILSLFEHHWLASDVICHIREMRNWFTKQIALR